MADIESPSDKVKRLMREAVPERTNVADFATAARKRGRPVAQSKTTMKIAGDRNVGVVGNHNQVNITVKAPSRQRVRVEVQRGPHDITEAQAADIQELVAKVVEASGKPFAAVWSTLKKKFRFTSYRLMPADQFEQVRTYLRRWIASANGPNDPSTSAVRKRLLGRIHAEANKVPGRIDQVRSYIHDRFGVQSLGDLSIDELQEVVRQFSF